MTKLDIEKNTLYLVGTPIGNLDDMSYRAVEVLSKVDFIAAEDTRISLCLLNHFDIKKPLVSYFEHNRKERGEEILGRIAAGESCALITDAGMPAISDPGRELCDLCHSSGIRVSVIPGPCAAICAVAASGMGNGRFTFEGFLSTAPKNRKAHLKRIATETRTMVFYEAPHKLKYTLNDLKEKLGDRELLIARELTKKFEEIKRTTLFDAARYYAENVPRGEFVLVIAGATVKEEEQMSDDDIKQMLLDSIRSGMKKKDAVAKVSGQTGEKKNRIYSLSLDIDTEKE